MTKLGYYLPKMVTGIDGIPTFFTYAGTLTR
ncbi:hypothetical protein CPS_1117 [Colwellia psychrerythraea 34H]|uniref:Uncharacterized protein n=1 Tax=Colwellia psychrerythraea (strain 34H / ATCC BAA-681) TaxID=167879 RepID=Q487A5_COLP3|nr:hypothetical protein CPS_1117 [Colwellia psychrerythraea 34H]